ncbi:MAG: dephospho-CoA kinase, partial [Enterococcus aquimarinus]
MTRVLGLTGGIATGKSTVVSIFRALGFPIVDGDEIARLIVEPGKPALAAIADHFGSAVLFENGELNRKKLGEMIFSNPTKREALDQLLDPY